MTSEDVQQLVDVGSLMFDSLSCGIFHYGLTGNVSGTFLSSIKILSLIPVSCRCIPIGFCDQYAYSAVGVICYSRLK